MLKKCTETLFEFMLTEEKVWRCFPRDVSYCCDAPQAKDMSSILHGAGRYHPSVRCMVGFEYMLHGGKRPNRLLVATAETRRQVQSLKEVAEMVSERVQRQVRVQELGEIVRLLS